MSDNPNQATESAIPPTPTAQPFPIPIEAGHDAYYGDFRRGASWRIFRIMGEFVEGFEFLANFKDKKVAAVYGSARTPPNHYHYAEARRLGKMLGEAGFAIVTGGGPGIMEAANRGATEAGAESIGLNIELPKEQRINPFVKRFRGFYYFFTRKVMLKASAQAYIYFPGGYGTLDELLELLVLIQTKKAVRVPIVIMGKQYWGGMVDWMRDVMLRENYIDRGDLELFHLVDTAEEAFEIVSKSEPRPYF
ncbi:MAG: TIGR00730 family Rossman fold protein [Patescibacteria group bacterium]|nr:TIGR00730 family Rossman fold protein [Patescibacteria group bacterium]